MRIDRLLYRTIIGTLVALLLLKMIAGCTVTKCNCTHVRCFYIDTTLKMPSLHPIGTYPAFLLDDTIFTTYTGFINIPTWEQTKYGNTIDTVNWIDSVLAYGQPDYYGVKIDTSMLRVMIKGYDSLRVTSKFDSLTAR